MKHSLLIVVALAICGRAGSAQTSPRPSPSGATVSGVVHDSISGTALRGADIQLVARDNPAMIAGTAVSDSLGRYTLQNVPIGRYRLGFFHPLLDSLGLETPLRDVIVDSDRTVTAELGVPSFDRLRTVICGAQAARDSGGVILGFVRDVHNSSPSAGATVSGDWLEYTVVRGALSRRLARRSATTGENGWFALCNVPSGGTVALIANKGADSTGLIEVDVPVDGLLRREMYLGATASETVIGPSRPGTALPPPRRAIRVGDIRMSGRVVSVEGNRPLSGAIVTVMDGPQARTNELGEWSMANAPGGTRMIEVRAVGYFPARKNVNIHTGSEPVNVTLSTLKAVLDTVRIRATRLARDTHDSGFMLRRRSGQGKYITAEDIRKFPAITTSDLFRNVAGVRFELDEFGQKTIKLRGVFEAWCSPTVFIDGQNMSSFAAADIDDWVPPHDVAGIEIYREGAVPPQFQVGLSGCGTIVIWTK